MARRLSLSSSPSSNELFSGPQGSISRSASLDKLPSYQYNDDSDNDFPEFQRVHFQENNNERNERNQRNDSNDRDDRSNRNDRNNRNERNERENRNGRVGRFNIVGPPAASRPATPTEDNNESPTPVMKTTRSQSLPSGCELQRFHEYRETHAFAPSVVSNKEIKGDAGYIKHELIVALLAEVIGTAILVSIGTGVILSADGDLLAVAIVWGFIVFGLIIAFGSVSGAHFNPCVTIAFFIINCRSHLPSQLIRLVTYIFAQMLGATLGASFTYTMLPGGHDVFFGTRRGPGVTIGQAYFIEAFITFILIFNAITVYHNIKRIADKEAIASNDVITSPFATAFIVTLDVVYAGPYTGASLNPARSFGPALVTGQWDDQWLYWCAPITGAIVAVIIYYGLNMDKSQRKIVKKFPRKVTREVSGRFHNLSRQNSPRGLSRQNSPRGSGNN